MLALLLPVPTLLFASCPVSTWTFGVMLYLRAIFVLRCGWRCSGRATVLYLIQDSWLLLAAKAGLLHLERRLCARPSLQSTLGFCKYLLVFSDPNSFTKFTILESALLYLWQNVSLFLYFISEILFKKVFFRSLHH